MADLFDIVSTGLQTGDGDLTTGIGRMRTGHQRGAGAVAVNAKLPTGQILAILRSLGQIKTTQIRGIEPEIGIQIAVGCTGQGDGCLVGRTRHIPDVIGVVSGRGYILCGLEDCGLGNGSDLVDVQIVAALIEFSTIAITETPS